MTALPGTNETKEEETNNNLSSFLQLLDSPQDLLQSILLAPSETNKEHQIQVDSLKLISKDLFSRVEKYASLYEKIDNPSNNGDGVDDDEDEEEACPLSGLSELYTGLNASSKEENKSNENDNDDDDFANGIMDEVVDAETIFHQVDVQNTKLLSEMKKMMKKLKKTIAKGESSNNDDNSIRLLNMEEMESDEDGGDDTQDESDDDNQNEDASMEQDDDSDDEDDEDEETKRIRQRMERSMAEIGDSDDNDDDDSLDEDDEEKNNRSKDMKKNIDDKEDDAIDPSREDLYDGFFDLHEMENFADEEEEMLPDEAYGQPDDEGEDENMEDTIESRKKMLPHVRGRQGAEDDDDEEDEEFNFLDKKVEKTDVRRKRYRDDEDIEALTGMYGDTANDDSDDEDEDDAVINMTAADFFGPPRKPSKSFLEKSKQGSKKKVSFEDDNNDDDDSWDNHDFAEDGKDWREADEDEKDESQHNNDNEDEAEDDENAEDDDEQENAESASNTLSTFAARSNKLDEMTKSLEKDMLAEKPWQMVGEAKATQRPTNSLLEVTPTFEFATKMAPIITAEHTESIEDMIKRRILAEDWDDVIPRELPDIGLSKRKGELPEVSQEKSKLSLGELYEREYLKKVTGYDADAAEKETEEEKVKNEMKMLFANLCSKLDALSNYHFAPRPVADEAEIKTTNTPAVAMEEVLPLHVSDAQAMAPEEVYEKKKGRDGILRSESEMDQTDRKRLRQSKKSARRKARKAKLADEKLISRLKPELGLNNPYEKRKMREELQMARASGKLVSGEIDQNADFKTSAKFFQKMQSDVQMSLKQDDSSSKKRKRNDEASKSSSFKL